MFHVEHSKVVMFHVKHWQGCGRASGSGGQGLRHCDAATWAATVRSRRVCQGNLDNPDSSSRVIQTCPRLIPSLFHKTRCLPIEATRRAIWVGLPSWASVHVWESQNVKPKPYPR